MTLGMPNLPQQWSNDQVLGFFRLMWQQWLLKSGRGTGTPTGEDAVRGPAPPAAVAAAAKIALATLGNSLGDFFHTEPHERPLSQSPPVEPASSALLERTDSGTLQTPSFADEMNVGLDEWVDNVTKTSQVSACSPAVPAVRGPLENPQRRNRNLQWLRLHFRSLNEVGRLPFNNADLWQLHQYYFSPPFGQNVEDSGQQSPKAPDVDYDNVPPPTPAHGPNSSSLERAVSFQTLGAALAASGLSATGANKRRSDSNPCDNGPASKRVKGLSKPRIAWYPRIMVSRMVRWYVRSHKVSHVNFFTTFLPG
jgi:hypothetical protein